MREVGEEGGTVVLQFVVIGRSVTVGRVVEEDKEGQYRNPSMEPFIHTHMAESMVREARGGGV